MRTSNTKTLAGAGALALLLAAVAGAQVPSTQALQGQTLVVTATNSATNQLLVFNAKGQIMQTIPTQGKGGVSGNSGGITVSQNTLAVVNFGSNTVSMFERSGAGLRFMQTVPTASSPVSVAFGNSHLYILGTTEVESHAMTSAGVTTNPDGVVPLVIADGSSAQVGVLPGQLIVTEKSNAIETVNLTEDGAALGPATMVANIPANVNAPFGLATHGNDAYVTIAHANEIALVRDGAVLTVVSSGTQVAPCWLALDEPFLFSSNTGSMSISRYAVYGAEIVQDAGVAASLNAGSTDIAHGAHLVAVISGNASNSFLTLFGVDEDGNLSQRNVSTMSPGANGVVILPPMN